LFWYKCDMHICLEICFKDDDAELTRSLQREIDEQSPRTTRMKTRRMDKVAYIFYILIK